MKDSSPGFWSLRAWTTRGDIDGFFGLFIDNLLQLMLLFFLCRLACGFSTEFLLSTVLPGAAVSLLAGNVFYARLAWKLARETHRSDVTALPYGINTPSLIAYVFLIMAPIYRETQNAHLAWQAGLFACFLSGVMECLGAFFGDFVRRYTPRAALLCALSGIAVTFIAMGFVFQMFASPLIALLPLFLIFATYAGKIRWPGGIPGGLLAVLLGTLIAWIAQALGRPLFHPTPEKLSLGFYTPKPALGDVFAMLVQPEGWRFFAVIFPMGLFNVLGSLQNLESAEAAGDRYATRPALLMNGAGSLAAAFFGSPFPTTIYIGHPGWKAMGARFGYSLWNGLVITVLCFSGAFLAVLKVIPIEATLGILLWIAVIITAQAFQEIPPAHSPAVALGLIPSLAAWGMLLLETAARAAGASWVEVFPRFGGDLYVEGAAALSQGFLLSAMIFGAIGVHLIERRFQAAAFWFAAAAFFSFFGIIHAYQITPAGTQNLFKIGAAWRFSLAYGACALIFGLLSRHPHATKPSSPGLPENRS